MVFNFQHCLISLKQLTDRPTSMPFSRPRSEGSHAFRNDKRDFPYNKCPSSKIVTQPPNTTITKLQCKAVLSDPVRYGPSGRTEAGTNCSQVWKEERSSSHVFLSPPCYTEHIVERCWEPDRLSHWSKWPKDRPTALTDAALTRLLGLVALSKNVH